MRYGTVAIVGRTNVGKSTFLNTALGTPLAIVSPKPQTTRDALLGVVNYRDAQLAFLDTPGLHRPKNQLGRRMNQQAMDSLRNADVVVFFTDVGHALSQGQGDVGPDGQRLTRGRRPSDQDGDQELLAQLPAESKVVLVVNKVDRLKDKSRLLPFIERMNQLHPFVATIPISALRADGVERVLAEVVALLPEAEARYAPDDLTDRPVSFFAREYIREQVLSLAGREVPHAVAVTLDSVQQQQNGLAIRATVHVEKPGQRSILVGRGGEMIKEIGSRARMRLAELTGEEVHLNLFVRVTERWRDMPRQLAELGYDSE